MSKRPPTKKARNEAWRAVVQTQALCDMARQLHECLKAEYALAYQRWAELSHQPVKKG